MKQIPNLFTLLNLVFGCIAIIYIFKDDGFLFTNKNGEFSIGLMIGAMYIFFAAVIDFLDGFVARLFGATSEMGAQLDSLADIVSFGVAPAMIIYRLLQHAYGQTGLSLIPFWYLMPALLIPCAGAWRLARFNIDKTQTYYFRGVPIPAAGLTFASFPFIINADVKWLNNLFMQPLSLYTAIGVISILMVSNIPLISLKFKNFSIKNNLDKVILLAITLIAIIFLKWAAIPIVFVAYVLVSLAFKPNKI